MCFVLRRQDEIGYVIGNKTKLWTGLRRKYLVKYLMTIYGGGIIFVKISTKGPFISFRNAAILDSILAVVKTVLWQATLTNKKSSSLWIFEPCLVNLQSPNNGV